MRLTGFISHRPLYFDSRFSQANKLKKVIHMDSRCPTSTFMLRRMKMNCIIKPVTVINRFLVAPDERREKVRQEILRPTFSLREKPLAEI
jgi:hypothetical protein